MAGKYKTEAGNHVCSLCESSVFLLDIRSTSDEACLYQYITKISFSIKASVDAMLDLFVLQCRSLVEEISLDLGIDRSKITRIEFEKSKSTFCCLLSMDVSCSIQSDSAFEAHNMETGEGFE